MRGDSEIQFSYQIGSDANYENSGLDHYGRPFKQITHMDAPGTLDILSCSTFFYDAGGNRTQYRIDRPPRPSQVDQREDFAYNNTIDNKSR